MKNKLVFHPSPIRRMVNIPRKPLVVRALCFDNVAEDCAMVDPALSAVEMYAFNFSAAPSQRPARTHKPKAVIVESEVRRSARLAALRDGFRHSNPAKSPMKKPAAKPQKKRKVTVDAELSRAPPHDADQPVPPPTPINVLQQVGLRLGIGPENLTKEKLEASSCKPSSVSSSCNDS